MFHRTARISHVHGGAQKYITYQLSETTRGQCLWAPKMRITSYHRELWFIKPLSKCTDKTIIWLPYMSILMQTRDFRISFTWVLQLSLLFNCNLYQSFSFYQLLKWKQTFGTLCSVIVRQMSWTIRNGFCMIQILADCNHLKLFCPINSSLVMSALPVSELSHFINVFFSMNDTS